MQSLRDRRSLICSSFYALCGGILSLGTAACDTPAPQPGPIQWQWSNDQTVCKDPNGVGSPNNYPKVYVRQIVARDDESIYGVGDYVLPSQGLPSEYGRRLPVDMYQDFQDTKDGPHAFQLDVASAGASASWSTVAQYSMHECFANTCMIQCKGLTCLNGTRGLGPFIEASGGDVAFFRKTFRITRAFSDMTTITCEEGDFSKRATPQWSLGTTDVCAHSDFAFTGDPAGNVVTIEDTQLKKYDPSGAIVLDTPTPFDFTPTALALSPLGDVHAAVRSTNEVRLARSDSSGKLLWSKTFSNPTPMDFPQTIDLAVDASGNSLIALNAYETIDVGTGPMASLGASDIVLAKFDVQGNVLWAKRMGGGGITLSSMRKTGADQIALVAHFTGIIDLGDGLLQSSPVLVKYDPDGNLVWRADLIPLYPGSTYDVLSIAVAGHPSGAVFVAGSGYGDASSTPEPNCDLGPIPLLPGTYPRPLRMFAAKYGP